MKWVRKDCTKDIFKTLKIVIIPSTIIISIVVVFVNFSHIYNVTFANEIDELVANGIVCTLPERKLQFSQYVNEDVKIYSNDLSVSSRGTTINSLNIAKISEFDEKKTEEKIEKTSTPVDTSIWKLEIPKIGLVATIVDGTSQTILSQYIGHFSETVNENGNIGLAAHNGGFKVNYFANIKNLVKNDVIYYTYNGVTRHYAVISQEIISEMDWSKLRQYGDDRLTLITCVTNRPSYRLCVQALRLY